MTPIWVRCEYVPRGKLGTPFCNALTFVGLCIRPAIEEGRYIVRDQTTVYAVQIQDMFELEEQISVDNNSC